MLKITDGKAKLAAGGSSLKAKLAVLKIAGGKFKFAAVVHFWRPSSKVSLPSWVSPIQKPHSNCVSPPISTICRDWFCASKKDECRRCFKFIIESSWVSFLWRNIILSNPIVVYWIWQYCNSWSWTFYAMFFMASVDQAYFNSRVLLLLCAFNSPNSASKSGMEIGAKPPNLLSISRCILGLMITIMICLYTYGIISCPRLFWLYLTMILAGW